MVTGVESCKRRRWLFHQYIELTAESNLKQVLWELLSNVTSVVGAGLRYPVLFWRSDAEQPVPSSVLEIYELLL